jgi:hypothetical protein
VHNLKACQSGAGGGNRLSQLRKGRGHGFKKGKRKGRSHSAQYGTPGQMFPGDEH